MLDEQSGAILRGFRILGAALQGDFEDAVLYSHALDAERAQQRQGRARFRQMVDGVLAQVLPGGLTRGNCHRCRIGRWQTGNLQPFDARVLKKQVAAPGVEAQAPRQVRPSLDLGLPQQANFAIGREADAIRARRERDLRARQHHLGNHEYLLADGKDGFQPLLYLRLAQGDHQRAGLDNKEPCAQAQEQDADGQQPPLCAAGRTFSTGGD